MVGIIDSNYSIIKSASKMPYYTTTKWMLFKTPYIKLRASSFKKHLVGIPLTSGSPSPPSPKVVEYH